MEKVKVLVESSGYGSLELPVIGLHVLLSALAGADNRAAIGRAEETVSRSGGNSRKIAVARYLGQIKAVRDSAAMVADEERKLLQQVAEVNKNPWTYAALVLALSGNSYAKRGVYFVNPNNVNWASPVDDRITLDMSGFPGLALVGVSF